MTLAPGSFLGRYEILEPLRASRLSEVYRGRDRSIQRFVAIKRLPAALARDSVWLRRFWHEARAAGGIDHPNIVTIYDVGLHDGCPYLVTEWLEGQTLRERLAVSEMGWREATEHAIEIAHGVAAAHSAGVVHRDLKPENVFLTREGRVKVLDFGLARTISIEITDPVDQSSPTIATVTEPGVILGTVGYMAPEQIRAEPADARSDIFAFGAILYEMIAGRRAFLAASSIETLVAILREEAPPFARPRDCPATLERIVRRCLEKQPERRFQSVRDVAYALEDSRGDVREQVPAVPLPAQRGSREPASRRSPDRADASPPTGESGFSLVLRDREIPLAEGSILVGRGRDATLRLQERSISRHHARIVVRGGAASVENLSEKNGTYVRGLRIASPTLVADGDEIRMGSVTMVLRARRSTASTETQAEL